MRKIILVVDFVYPHKIFFIDLLAIVIESAAQSEIRSVFKFRKLNFSGNFSLIFSVAFAFYGVRKGKNGVLGEFYVI